MDITKLNVQELKAIAYDLIVQLDIAKNNLAVVNQAIGAKAKEDVPEVDEVKE